MLWKKIKAVKYRGNTQLHNYPTLVSNDIKYSTDEKKAGLFANLLSET
jgi:hypothetical protein